MMFHQRVGFIVGRAWGDGLQLSMTHPTAGTVAEWSLGWTRALIQSSFGWHRSRGMTLWLNSSISWGRRRWQ